MPDKTGKQSRTSSARTLGAWALTAVWAAGILYVVCLSPDKFKALLSNPHDFAEFSAGAVGPLALLWLIVGYFQQSEELELQREQLKEQAAETRRLAEAARGSELQARRDVFTRMQEIAFPKMNVAASRILKAWNPNVQTAGLWEQFGNGDREIFFNYLVNAIGRNFEVFQEQLPRIVAAHYEIGQYEILYKFLWDEAKSADPENHSVLRLLEHSGMANLMHLLGRARGINVEFIARQMPENPSQLTSPWGE